MRVTTKMRFGVIGWDKCDYMAHPTLRRMVTGLLDIKLGKERVCKGCALGNRSKDTFPHDKTRSKVVLYLVYYDISGPISMDSITRYLHFVTFIDDFSRNTWIYFLKNKVEVFS